MCNVLYILSIVCIQHTGTALGNILLMHCTLRIAYASTLGESVQYQYKLCTLLLVYVVTFSSLICLLVVSCDNVIGVLEKAIIECVHYHYIKINVYIL